MTDVQTGEVIWSFICYVISCFLIGRPEVLMRLVFVLALTMFAARLFARPRRQRAKEKETDAD